MEEVLVMQDNINTIITNALNVDKTLINEKLVIDLIKNDSIFIPNLLDFFKNYYWIFLILLFISFIFNNLK